MKNIRLAVRLIWTAYGALALAVALFAVTIWIRPDAGVVIIATILLGASGAVVELLLLSGSVLGTHALMKQKTLRRPIAVVTVLVGWLGSRSSAGSPGRFGRTTGHTDIEPQKGKPGNGSRPEPKRTREGQGSERQVGESDSKRRRADGLEGVRSAGSTRRTGEPFTGGRGGQKEVAHKGNLGRTRKAGQTKPTSLRGIATKEATPFAEARLSEEPGAGKLHGGICVGQLASLPR